MYQLYGVEQNSVSELCLNKAEDDAKKYINLPLQVQRFIKLFFSYPRGYCRPEHAEGSVDIEAHMIKCRQFTDIDYKFFHFDNQSNRIIVLS
ncbi:hypothetical protein [Brumicola blandensis]|uniref:Uncharacterized protein n=1 Tax=Brumicola blandensis TaxID=3075611 RepID=A0AAW8QW49_9ALTE|nr:hypothetical protein [Alteromonas sp. W409]MDT0581019.1 hypothetical protein [Alteromonas sp. W409]